MAICSEDEKVPCTKLQFAAKVEVLLSQVAAS